MKLTVPVKSWTAIAPDVDQIKAHLATVGPLSALMDATGLQRYKSGVWTGKMGPFSVCTKTALNHAVLLVGFGEDYFIVKNSWGEAWGEQGYFRIAFEACAITTQITVGFVDGHGH